MTRSLRRSATPTGTTPATVRTALAELYASQYDALVRLSALILHELAGAEEIVQDAFVALFDGPAARTEGDYGAAATVALRRDVLERTRERLRRSSPVIPAQRDRSVRAPVAPSSWAELRRREASPAESQAISLLEQEEVVAALRRLPARQREALALRYYAELSEAEIAAAMGVSKGSVKVHVSRGMAALRASLTPTAGEAA